MSSSSTPPQASARADYRQLLALASPIAAGSAITTAARLTDMAMMGHSSVKGLAGVAAGMAVTSFFASIVVAAASGQQILAARRFGADKPRAAASSLIQSLVFAGVVAAGCLTLMLLAPSRLVGMISHSEIVTAEGVRYLLARAPALLLAVPTTVLIVTLNGAGETRWSFRVSAFGAIVNVALDYPLIFGLGPIPAMGALGNGLSSTIADAAGLLFLLSWLSRNGTLARLGLRRAGLRVRDLRLVAKLSIPAMTSMALDYLGSAVMLSVIGLLGATALATGRIAITILQFFFMITASCGTACQLLIGRVWGAHDHGSISRLRRRMIELVTPMMVAASIPLWFWPAEVTRLFSGFSTVVASSAGPLRVLAVGVPVMVLAYANVATLRAIGRVRDDMLSNIVSIWLVQLPVAYLCGVRGHRGLTGALLGVVAYWTTRALITTLMLPEAAEQPVQAPVPI